MGIDFLTVEEVATIIRVKESAVRNYINNKELKAYKLGSSWQIDKNDLMNFIESRANFQDETQN